MLDHNGIEMVEPYIGCIAGCAKDYCYLFGRGVHFGYYVMFWMALIIITFMVLSLFFAWFWGYCKSKKYEKEQKD